MNKKQEAIFDAVVDQRNRREPADILVYDFYEGQDYLNSNDLSNKCGIEITDQLGILQELTEMGVFPHADFIEVDDPDNEPNKGSLIRKGEKYYQYQILLNHKDIQQARKKFKKNFKAELVFEDKECTYYHIFVDIDGGKVYKFKKIREDGHPYELIKYAVGRRKDGYKDFIYRDELLGKQLIKNSKTNVKALFQDFETATVALPRFIELAPNGIRINFKVTLSLTEVKLIEKYSKK